MLLAAVNGRAGAQLCACEPGGLQSLLRSKAANPVWMHTLQQGMSALL